jgi:hypothetical protein
MPNASAMDKGSSGFILLNSFSTYFAPSHTTGMPITLLALQWADRACRRTSGLALFFSLEVQMGAYPGDRDPARDGASSCDRRFFATPLQLLVA